MEKQTESLPSGTDREQNGTIGRELSFRTNFPTNPYNLMSTPSMVNICVAQTRQRDRRRAIWV